MTLLTSIVIILFLLIGIFELLRYRRKKVIDRFLEVNTVLAESAKSLKQLGISDMFSVRLLVKNELLKIADGDRYYMDLLRYTELGYFYRRVFSIAMTILVIVLISGIIYVIA